MQPAPVLIRDNDVILVRGGDYNRLITVRPSLSLKVGRLGVVHVGSLVGQPADGTYRFEPSTRRLVPATDGDLPDLDGEMGAELPDDRAANIDVEEAGDAGGARDNRNLLDRNTAQTLTTEDLRAMKQEGAVADIVTALVQNSATFAQKTAFSQEKYVKRKKNKYNMIFRVEVPTIDSLCELWAPCRIGSNLAGHDDPQRWVRMRIDAVGQVLAAANIWHSSRVLVYERTNGFLPAAVLERLGEAGRMYHVLPPNGHPSRLCANAMRLPMIKERWACVPIIDTLYPDLPPTRPPLGDGSRPRIAPAAAKPDGEAESDTEEPGRPRSTQWLTGVEARELFKAQPADCLIVADDEDPHTVAQALMPLVALSAPIVVYCPYAEPLYKLHTAVRDEVVGARIQETWLREMQVLPGRTHPLVNMSHTGGYIFTATRVQHLHTVRPPATAGVKRERDGEAE
jgi:tRNA (adenine-N(1)-)-methyltransferase non-catalytic subunit